MRRGKHLTAATLVALSCLSTATARAEVAQDAELWLEAGLQYEPVRRLRLSFDQHFRANNLMSTPESMMSELGLRYRPLRWLAVGGGYRLAFTRNDSGAYALRHRLHIQGATRHNLGPIRLGFRLRFQEEARASSDDGDQWRHVLRGRVRVQLRRLPVDPFLSFEAFLRLANDGVAAEFRKLRATCGIEFDTAAGELALGYRLEVGLDDSSLAHVLMLGWHVDVGPDR